MHTSDRAPIAVVLALLVPAAAAADSLEELSQSSLSETERTVIRMLALGDIEHSFDLSAQASLAGMTGRQTGGQASAGGEIAWNLGVCRALVGGGQGTADKTAEAHRLSGSFWGGFCLPFPMNRFEMVLRTDYQLQPRLSALPVARRASYTGFTVDFKNTFVGWRSPRREHAVLPFTFSIGTFAQAALDVGKGGVTIAAYRRTDTSGRTLEILPVELRSAGPALGGGNGGVYLSTDAFELSPFRLLRTEAGSLGDLAVEADFVAGLGYGAISAPREGGMQVAPILYRTYDLFTDITVRATRGKDTFSAHLRRAFEPSTRELLLDTRGELSGSATKGASCSSAVRCRHAAWIAGPIDSTPSAGGARSTTTRCRPTRSSRCRRRWRGRSTRSSTRPSRSMPTGAPR